MKHGKAYVTARKQIDREQLYSPVEAVKLLKGLQTAKFERPWRRTSASGSTSATPTSSCAAR